MESLPNNYFKTTIRSITSEFSIPDNVHTRFYHPKLAIINKNQVDIVDVEAENTADVVYKADAPISHVHLHKNYLWVLFDGLCLKVINLLRTASINLIFQNASFRVKHLKRNGEEIAFLSESGECFTTSLPMSDIRRLLNDNANSNIDLQYVKLRCDFSLLEADDQSIGTTSLTLSTHDSHSLRAQCSNTGLQVMVNFNQAVGKFATFRDSDHLIVQLRNQVTELWDIVLTRVSGEFILKTCIESDAGHPVGGVGDSFYYISVGNEGFHVNCVKRHEPLTVARALASCGKYDEAHDYALKNDLDVQPLLKMKLIVLTENVQSGDTVDISTFVEIFEQITDLEFLVEQASKLCQYCIAYKALVINLKQRCTDQAALLENLQDVLAKIQIIEFIDLRNGCEYIKHGNIFSSSLSNLCLQFVSNGDVDMAAIAWSKHTTITQDINVEDAVDILNATPQLIKLNALMVWLRTFFPTIVHKTPFFVDSIVKWAVDRVFSLETSKYWPDIGIKFISDVLQVLHEIRSSPTSIRPPSIDKLNLLTLHINNVKLLKEKYRVNILIRELTVESPADVVKIILHRCYTEDLKMLMEEYLPSYVSKHGLDYDTLVREYVEQLLAAAAVDDARLPLVIQAMHSDEERVACVLHVVDNIEVPWSESVYRLAIEASESDQQSSEKIKTQLKYANLKMVLRKHNFSLTSDDYENLLLKIISSPTVELEDLKTVVEVAGRLRNYANLLYVNRCLQKSDVKEAHKYCNELERPEKRAIARSIMIYFESLLASETGKSDTEINYLDFLKGFRILSESQLNNISKLYHLKNSYGISMSANSFCTETGREDILTSWCKINGSNMPPNVYYMKSSNLARLLEIERKEAIPIILLHMKEKLHLTTLEAMLSNSKELILENLIEDFDLSLFLDGQQLEVLQNYIVMLTEFMRTCRDDLVHSSLETLSALISIKNCAYFVDNSSIAWKFHYIFMPISTYSSMNDFVMFLKKLSSVDSNQLLSSVMTRNDIVPMRMLSEISRLCESGLKPSAQFNDTRERIAKQMLSKILLSQHNDDLLVTSLLHMLSAPDDWLRDLYDSQSSDSANKTCLLSYMTLAEKVLGFRELVPRTTTGCQQVLKNKYNLDITDFACIDEIDETTNMKFVMFNVLKANLNMDIECLQDVSKTFNVSLNDSLSIQVLALISSWDLKYQIFRDALDRKQIEIKIDERELHSRCAILTESIKNKDYLIESLKSLWANGEFSICGQTVSINPYHYEVFLCIYRLLSKLTNDAKMFKELILLQFLKQYRRVSLPRQNEMEIFSVKGSFPEIGCYRLPFHMFTKDDMWSNLKYEITLKSYKRWLPIVTMLRLDKEAQKAQDMLCSTAVKQTMTQQKLTNDSNLESWKLFVTNESLLKQAHECVRHITNMEWAVACLFHVLQGTRRGADQLAAAELMYNFAQQWSKLQPNNNVVKKMQYKYCTLSTMHILHKMGYKEDRFLQLCTDPGVLIKALYADKSYAENMLEFDANKYINDIADKNSVNINSIRYQILENILDQKIKRPTDGSLIGLDDSELTRARYILKATDPNVGAIYLARIALDADSDFNKGKKLRALQCLMSIVDPDTLLKIRNLNRSALKSSLLDLYFSIELERIDMPFIVATFIEDKQRALKQLWHSAEKSADTLSLVARMGTVYPLSEQILQELLTALVQSDLVDDLCRLLPHIKCVQTQACQKAWSKVLVTPFEKADHPVSERQRGSCINAINMLPQCPSICHGDLQSIWRNCVRCKSVELGCLVLPYMSTEQRSSVADWSKVDRRNLIAGIKNLHAQTFLVITALSVVDSLTARKI